MHEATVYSSVDIDPKIIRGHIKLDDLNLDLHDLAIVPDLKILGEGEYEVTGWRIIPRTLVDTRELDDIIKWNDDKTHWIAKLDRDSSQ